MHLPILLKGSSGWTHSRTPCKACSNALFPHSAVLFHSPKNTTQRCTMEELATSQIHTQNKRGATCHQSNRCLLLTIAVMSYLAVSSEAGDHDRELRALEEV